MGRTKIDYGFKLTAENRIYKAHIYEHPDLDLKTIQKYYKKFHREFYFRPSYLFNKFIIGIKKNSV